MKYVSLLILTLVGVSTAKYLLVDVKEGGGNVREKDEINPDLCSCEHTGAHWPFGGCRITEPAPPGYKCYCYIAFLFTCNGEPKKCRSEEEPGCHGCKEKECCDGLCTYGVH